MDAFVQSLIAFDARVLIAMECGKPQFENNKKAGRLRVALGNQWRYRTALGVIAATFIGSQCVYAQDFFFGPPSGAPKGIQVSEVIPSHHPVAIFVDKKFVGGAPVSGDGKLSYNMTVPLAAGVRTIEMVDTSNYESAVTEVTIDGGPVLDFDGDGITDPGTYSLNFERLVIRWLASATNSVGVGKMNGKYAVPADYLGNGKTQPAAVEVRNSRGPSKGSLIWSILDPETNQVRRISFGKTGDTIISGCRFLKADRAALAFVRGRVLFMKNIDTGTRTIRLRNFPRGDISGCGDTNGDGIDELIARTPVYIRNRPSSNMDSVSVFQRNGTARIFKKVERFSSLTVVRRPGYANIPLVILSRGLATDMPGIDVESLAGTFQFPILPLLGDVELTSGIFKDEQSNTVAGLLWRPKGQNRIVKRLLQEGSTDSEVFRIWSLEKLIKAINIQKTTR